MDHRSMNGPSVEHQWTICGSSDHERTPADDQWTICGPPDHERTLRGPSVDRWTNGTWDHEWTRCGPSVDHQCTSGPSDHEWALCGPSVDHLWTSGPSDHEWKCDHCLCERGIPDVVRNDADFSIWFHTKSNYDQQYLRANLTHAEMSPMRR